ncbi:MAG: CYTH domain-containing protein [Rhodospirillaceae bacterium]|nr:CYTH domain-containing protein [Rhodospirillaceae bacterium]
MSRSNSPVEVELKLRLAKDEVPRLMRHRLLHRAKGAGLPKAKRLVSVYYDTANFDLHHNKAALRVRNEGKRKTCPSSAPHPAAPRRGRNGKGRSSATGPTPSALTTPSFARCSPK